MNTSTRYSPEVRERAVGLVIEHQGEHDSQWAAIGSIAGKIGCTAARYAGGCARLSVTKVGARG